MIELKKEKFKDLISSLKVAKINTLFAMSVLEGKVDGKVFVDNLSSPSSFYLQHPYGMSLLYGESSNNEFYQELKPYLLNFYRCRKKTEWLQVYPAALYPKMEALFGERLIKMKDEKPYSNLAVAETDNVLEYERINYNFRIETYLAFKKNLENEVTKIVITTEDSFNQMAGNVVPKNFWDSYIDFKKYGIGFTLLLDDNTPASTAFSAYVIDRKMEIGIETDINYRGSGYAERVCAQLIDYCLENGLEPVWSCSSGNMGSRKLAGKLGFVESKRIPYYRLPF